MFVLTVFTILQFAFSLPVLDLLKHASNLLMLLITEHSILGTFWDLLFIDGLLKVISKFLQLYMYTYGEFSHVSVCDDLVGPSA